MESKYNKRAKHEAVKRKKGRSFADYIVFVSIFMVATFTIAAFVLQFCGMMEISATLTTCWFGFWTVEIVALAAIRTSKVKNHYSDYGEKKEDNNDGISG
jgi:hypothetical protein